MKLLRKVSKDYCFFKLNFSFLFRFHFPDGHTGTFVSRVAIVGDRVIGKWAACFVDGKKDGGFLCGFPSRSRRVAIDNSNTDFLLIIYDLAA